MWVVLLMLVEMEVFMKEILPETPDTFLKLHTIHCLYFLFWLSSASVPSGFGVFQSRGVALLLSRNHSFFPSFSFPSPLYINLKAFAPQSSRAL